MGDVKTSSDFLPNDLNPDNSIDFKYTRQLYQFCTRHFPQPSGGTGTVFGACECDGTSMEKTFTNPAEGHVPILGLMSSTERMWRIFPAGKIRTQNRHVSRSALPSLGRNRLLRRSLFALLL
jgi:hypothetical protein